MKVCKTVVAAVAVTMAAAASSWAAMEFRLAPIGSKGTPSTVALSSSTQDWTRVPPAGTNYLAPRDVLTINWENDSNVGRVVGFIGDTASTSTVNSVIPSTASVYPLEYEASTTPADIKLDNNSHLWLLNRSTFAITISYQEFRTD